MQHLNVSVWEEKIVIPTYAVGKPDKNPMFFEKRVYQGSSGVVYPNPIIEKIADHKEDREYTGLFLENKYLKIMVLPELGGRIQMAFDKIKQRHFIYYNQVIKPALVGLTGPWISGGIEFNWPQHHRPSTFEPIDYKLEEHADGSKTVWVNEVERMFHTKGMTGFTLHPDTAYIEIKAKLFNRSSLPQTFLWWANPAVKVNDFYQSVFPPDVNAVFDHGKRDVSDFPIATGTYYKVNYAPGTDISMYKNIPVPTSYMAINSDYDFVGGYEHDTQAGLLHVADHHVSPGKKQWTWGNGDFGQAWDRNLTDEDGPYIELMTGVFTDNQPDFSWLMPYEEKSFTQYFLPYRELGMVKNASKDILLAAELKDKRFTIKIQVTAVQRDLSISIFYKKRCLYTVETSIYPENIFTDVIETANGAEEEEFSINISNSQSQVLLQYDPSNNKNEKLPEPAKPALEPTAIATTEQLFLTGQHLEQYRHATYSPVPYYEEALRREPADIRNNNALGKWYLRKGQFSRSEVYFRKAVAAVTGRNPNPYDSEPYYNLGLALRYQWNIDAAYDAFYKATWSNAWKDAGYLCVAQIDLCRYNYESALEHVNLSLERNSRNGKAYLLKAHALRKLGRLEEAINIANEALKLDQFNISVLFELHFCYLEMNENDLADNTVDLILDLSRGTAHNFIEYAIDFAETGAYQEAIELLLYTKGTHISPLVNYYIGYYWHKRGDADSSISYFWKACETNPDYCFPNRLEDVAVLQQAIIANPTDAKAPYYLGNFFYDKRQYAEAISYWEQSFALDNTFPTVQRNLGLAAFNKQNDSKKALRYFESAFKLDPTDARVLMELDQLYKRLNYSTADRLRFLEDNLEIANQRDDVYLERVTLCNLSGEYAKALDLLLNRQFHPWEGGEGKASGQYVFSLMQLAKKCLTDGKYEEAINYLKQAKIFPYSLGEGKLYGARENGIDYWLGNAYLQAGQLDLAKEYFEYSTMGSDEPSAAIFYNDQQPDQIFYQGLSWRKLEDSERADRVFKKLVEYGIQHEADDVRVDYFAVSLPNLLIFDDDLNLRNTIHTKFMKALGLLGMGDFSAACESFQDVLKLDVTHAGATTHLPMAKQALSITEQAIK